MSIAPLPWREEARQRMERAPGFIRKRVMAYIETYARQQGYPEVTLEVMDEARRGTFMSGPFAASVLRSRPPKSS
ncbi:MAG: PCP reductase family protein [Chloroflexi bacterium]|nr:PCP reductase family protein [Chloroflexota bacterium]